MDLTTYGLEACQHTTEDHLNDFGNGSKSLLLATATMVVVESILWLSRKTLVIIY